jgi:hypothetical protein
MSIDDDSAWLDALAGRGGGTPPGDDAAGPQAAAVRDAQALRELIRAQEFDLDAAVPPIDPARERELIARAIAEGLLPHSALRPARRWYAGLRGVSAAAAVLVVAIGIGLFRFSREPVETLRGTENGTVHLETPDPSALKRRLTSELSAAGVRVSGYERLGHPGIDADLPQPLPPPVQHILEAHHIPIPSDGVLVVEFDEPSAR